LQKNERHDHRLRTTLNLRTFFDSSSLQLLQQSAPKKENESNKKRQVRL